MILLLDTTVLIDVLRMRRGRRALLADLVRNGHVLGTAAINLGEVYAGMRPGEEAATELLLGGLECYPMTGAIGRRDGLLKGRMRGRVGLFRWRIRSWRLVRLSTGWC